MRWTDFTRIHTATGITHLIMLNREQSVTRDESSDLPLKVLDEMKAVLSRHALKLMTWKRKQEVNNFVQS